MYQIPVLLDSHKLIVTNIHNLLPSLTHIHAQRWFQEKFIIKYALQYIVQYNLVRVTTARRVQQSQRLQSQLGERQS